MTSSRLAAFLTPRSIALVGCPSDVSRPGARPLVYLKKHGYPGRIYPVNQRHSEIGDIGKMIFQGAPKTGDEVRGPSASCGNSRMLRTC